MNIRDFTACQAPVFCCTPYEHQRFYCMPSACFAVHLMNTRDFTACQEPQCFAIHLMNIRDFTACQEPVICCTPYEHQIVLHTYSLFRCTPYEQQRFYCTPRACVSRRVITNTDPDTFVLSASGRSSHDACTLPNTQL